MRLFQMINEYYPMEFVKLKNKYFSLKQTTLCIVSGDLGSGKTTLIEQVINESCNKNQIIKVQNIINDVDIYSSFKEAVDTHNIAGNIHINPATDVIYSKQIISNFINMCQNFPRSTIYFSDLGEYDNVKILKTIYETIKLLVYLHPDLKLFIILECSKNCLSADMRDIYYDIRALTTQDDLIELPKLSQVSVIKYFKSLFFESINISEHMIVRLCKSAFSNLLYIKRYVEYLKDINAIYFRNGTWYCEDIDINLSYEYLKTHIENRYNKLDLSLQDVLQKASITGQTIDTSLMKRPLKIIKPEEKLSIIEKQSHLVEHVYKQFNFETEEIFCHVKKQMNTQQLIKLHNAIAEYLQNDFSPNLIKDSQYHIRRKSYIIAEHYFHCQNHDAAFKFYLMCIALSKNLKDFDVVITCCQKALDIWEILSYNSYYLQFIYWNIAFAYERLSEFNNAIKYYKKLLACIEKNGGMYNEHNIKLHYGFSLRRGGHTSKAYEYLELLKKELVKNSDDKSKEVLTEVLIILMGIVDQLGKKDLRERYYNWSLTLSQNFKDLTLYNKLLTKSSMYYTSEIAYPMMKDAFEFFNNRNNRFETAIASFNLGMDQIYCYNLANAKEYLDYSYEIFATYGGNNICYPTCGLGILSAINEDYKVSIKYFHDTIRFATNDFSKIVAFTNLSHCYRKEKNYRLAREQLDIAVNILSNNEKDKLVLKRNVLFANAMLLLDENKSKSEVLECLLNALDVERKQLQYKTYNVYLSKMIVKIMQELSMPIDSEIKSIAEEHLTKYKQKCFDQQVMWGNFMFW